MQKEFDNWNIRKENLHTHGEWKFYHVREIWWCAMGVNIGSEQDGGGEEYRRPVLILKAFGHATCLVVPLTRSTHSHSYRIALGKVAGEDATALISQIRVVDTKRLVRKIEFLNKDIFEHIRKVARDML